MPALARLAAMPKFHDVSLDDLEVLLAVCEAAGFRAAARRLGRAPSNVSETVARLEARLGVPLLVRSTRSLMPTEAGRDLVARVAPLLVDVRSALQEVTGTDRQVRGLLKLNVTGAVMVDILPPLIDRFLLRHPATRVELVVEDRLVDAIAEGCMGGIRYGEHLAQDMIAVPIGPRFQQLALAASPAYLARRGVPLHPAEIAAHDCIRLRFSSGALTAWDFEREGEVVRLDPPGRLVIGVDAAPAAIDLARAGHGLLCTFRNWLDPHFASGDLLPVLAEWWLRFEGPRLYFPSRLMPAALRAFVDLVAELREDAGSP